MKELTIAETELVSGAASTGFLDSIGGQSSEWLLAEWALHGRVITSLLIPMV